MKVSIIIPVYNAAEYLREAVSSALAQPEVAEVVLVDDGSKDHSLEIARALANENSRVVVLTHPNGSNRGSAETRNVGIRAATQEYIAFIDADDWFLPNRFARTKQIFVQYPDADGVCEAVVNVITDKAQSYSQTVSLEGTPDIHMVHQAASPSQLLTQLIDDPNGIVMLQGLCVKKSLFHKSGLFDPEFRVFEDMLLIKKMAAVGNLYLGHLTQPVSARRIHDTNISFSSFKDTDRAKYKEGEVLLRWACTKPLANGNMNAAIRFYYRTYFYSHGKQFSDKRLKFKWLLSTLFRYPKSVCFKQYWAAVPVVGKLIK
jgi:glycosyltransferase involved in cell wall biosynthesis